MEYSDNDKQIAQILYDKMKTLQIGTEISVSELRIIALEKHQTEYCFPMFDLWNVMNALRYMMNTERKLRMDFTKHELLCEGLPFNIPFVLLKWGQRIYTKEVRIARSFAKSNNLYGVKFVCYLYDKWVFRIMTEPGLVVDLAYPPTYIIVTEESEVRYSTPEEGCEVYQLTHIL